MRRSFEWDAFEHDAVHANLSLGDPGTGNPSEIFEKWAEVRHLVAVKAKRVRLFVKPYCGWCQKAVRWLEERGVAYEAIDVIADEAAYDEMIRISGQELAPVIDVDGQILADFCPDQLAEFWRKQEQKHARIHSA